MKQNKKLFKFKVFEVLTNDAVGEARRLVYSGQRYGVSEKQVEARVRYSMDFVNRDLFGGSTNCSYVFDFEEVSDGVNIKRLDKEDLEINSEGYYNNYSYVLGGIEYSSDSDAYDNNN